MGAGPKIGLIGLPYLILTILVSSLYGETFRYATQYNKPLFVAGIIVLIIGVIFYMMTARLLIRGLRQTRMITAGTYFCCRNPLYAAFIVLIIPGVSLLMNSWLILTASVVTYVAFKVFIGSEYRELERVFGEPYVTYKRETPELIPFPVKKILQLLKR